MESIWSSRAVLFSHDAKAAALVAATKESALTDVANAVAVLDLACANLPLDDDNNDDRRMGGAAGLAAGGRQAGLFRSERGAGGGVEPSVTIYGLVTASATLLSYLIKSSILSRIWHA
jgi:hypothetical protein